MTAKSFANVGAGPLVLRRAVWAQVKMQRSEASEMIVHERMSPRLTAADSQCTTMFCREI